MFHYQPKLNIQDITKQYPNLFNNENNEILTLKIQNHDLPNHLALLKIFSVSEKDECYEYLDSSTDLYKLKYLTAKIDNQEWVFNGDNSISNMTFEDLQHECEHNPLLIQLNDLYYEFVSEISDNLAHGYCQLTQMFEENNINIEEQNVRIPELNLFYDLDFETARFKLIENHIDNSILYVQDEFNKIIHNKYNDKINLSNKLQQLIKYKYS